MADDSGQEVHLHSTMDAEVWASEFMRVYRQRDPEGRPLGLDHPLMVAWFANAIMTGYDHANWRRDRVEVEHQLGDPPGSHWIYDRTVQQEIESFEGYPGRPQPITALRYALRAATSFGKTDRIDPDAVEQEFVKVMLGKPASGLPDDDGGPHD